MASSSWSLRCTSIRSSSSCEKEPSSTRGSVVATSVTYSTKRRRNNERRRRLACPLSVVAEYEDDQRPTSPRSLRSKRKSAVKSGSPVFSFRSDPPTFRLALIALSNGGRARVRSLDWLRSLFFFSKMELHRDRSESRIRFVAFIEWKNGEISL